MYSFTILLAEEHMESDVDDNTNLFTNGERALLDYPLGNMPALHKL